MKYIIVISIVIGTLVIAGKSMNTATQTFEKRFDKIEQITEGN